MMTPSHFLMTAALHKGYKRRLSIHRGGVLLGSVAPDIPLFLLTLGASVSAWLRGVRDLGDVHGLMFEDRFFHDPLWIVSHNFLHAPLLLAAGLAIFWRDRNRIGSWRHGAFWFLLAATLHTGIDVLTHHSDGPLLFFPFDWNYRFPSPVSYWEAAYFGRQFFVLELLLDITLTVYLFRGRLAGRPGRAPP